MTKEEALSKIQETFDNHEKPLRLSASLRDWMAGYEVLGCRQDYKNVVGMNLCIWHLRLRLPTGSEFVLSCGENLEAYANDHVNPYTDWGICGVWNWDYNCYKIERIPDDDLDDFMNDAFGDEIREIIASYAYDAVCQRNREWADNLIGKTITEITTVSDDSVGAKTDDGIEFTIRRIPEVVS